MNFYLNSQERFIREIDGLVFLKNNEVALIEAKSSVSHESIDQLLRAVKDYKTVYPNHIVHPFIGGPNFSQDMKNIAITKGLNIVDFSGDRYQVTINKGSNIA